MSRVVGSRPFSRLPDGKEREARYIAQRSFIRDLDHPSTREYLSIEGDQKMKLAPDHVLFSSCYPDWLADVAELIAEDTTGATFGIYGRWGSGKSSACQALIRPLYEQAFKLNTYIEVKIINAFEMRRSENVIKDALAQIQHSTQLKPQKTSADPSKRIDTNRLATVIAKPLVTLGSLWAQREGGLPKEVVEAGTPAAEALIEQTLVRVANEVSSSADENAILECDKLVLFIDDLDRCEPKQALTFLSETTDSIAAINRNVTINTVISCDPDVLGKHAAEIFNVTYVEGLESIAKYIHAPLNLPTGKTKKHSETIQKSIPQKNKTIALPLKVAAELAIGKIPIREIISALPQAYLWVNRVLVLFPDSLQGSYANQNLGTLCKVALWLSIASIALPGILRYAVGVGEDGLNYIPALNKLQSTANATDKTVTVFGTAITEAMRLRPDLAELGVSLLGTQFDSNIKTKLLPVIGGYSL